MGRYRLHGFVTICPGSPALSWVLGFIPSRLLWGGLQVGTGQPRAFWSRDLIQANSLGTPRAGAQSWALSPVECCPRWGVPSLTVTMQDCPSQVPAWGLSQSRAPTRGGGRACPKHRSPVRTDGLAHGPETRPALCRHLATAGTGVTAPAPRTRRAVLPSLRSRQPAGGDWHVPSPPGDTF